MLAPEGDEWASGDACSSIAAKLAGMSPSAMRKSPMSDADSVAGSIHQVG